MSAKLHIPPARRADVVRLCQLQRDGAICARRATLFVGPDDLVPVCDECYLLLLDVQRRTAEQLERMAS